MAKFERVSLIEDDVRKMTEEDIDKFIRQYGKIANTRLRELERANMTRSSNAYRWVKKAEYDKQKGYDKINKKPIKFITTTKDGKVKFITAVKKYDIHEKRNIASAIRDFVNAKTSTPAGVKNKYDKAYDTFMENHPELRNIDKESFRDYWRSGLIRKWGEIYGSNEVTSFMEEDKLSIQDIEKILTKEGFRSSYKVKNEDRYTKVRQKIEKLKANQVEEEKEQEENSSIPMEGESYINPIYGIRRE